VSCCDPRVYDDRFDARSAEQELRAYRRSGPDAWTGRLIDELQDGGVDGMTVLDIGAGVGAVHHALLEAGAASAIDVDASAAYLAASQSEGIRRGLDEQITYYRGDAVALAGELPPADLVALDRVVCCYVDMPGLVAAAASHTRRRLGLVLPRDDAWVRALVAIANGWNRLRRDPFRVYAHRTAAVEGVATAAGLVIRSTHKGLFWQSLVFDRPGAA
jgi:magnesium-protoporphyrin O-methyltransferase